LKLLELTELGFTARSKVMEIGVSAGAVRACRAGDTDSTVSVPARTDAPNIDPTNAQSTILAPIFVCMMTDSPFWNATPEFVRDRRARDAAQITLLPPEQSDILL